MKVGWLLFNETRFVLSLIVHFLSPISTPSALPPPLYLPPPHYLPRSYTYLHPSTYPRSYTYLHPSTNPAVIPTSTPLLTCPVSIPTSASLPTPLLYYIHPSAYHAPIPKSTAQPSLAFWPLPPNSAITAGSVRHRERTRY